MYTAFNRSYTNFNRSRNYDGIDFRIESGTPSKALKNLDSALNETQTLPKSRGSRPSSANSSRKPSNEKAKPSRQGTSLYITPKHQVINIEPQYDDSIDLDSIERHEGNSTLMLDRASRKSRKRVYTDDGEEIDRLIDEDVEDFLQEQLLKESSGIDLKVKVKKEDHDAYGSEDEPEEFVDEPSEDEAPPKSKKQKTPTAISLILTKGPLKTKLDGERRKGSAKPLISLRSIIALPPSRTTIRAPDSSLVPLSKKKANEKQKTMYVDTHRILTESSRDRRLRVNTLDVFKQLIVNYEPKLHKNRYINEETTHEEFKAHFLNQLDLIIGTHSSIKDLTTDIINVQKRKTEMRRKIYELKNNHADVGNKLNRMRAQYNNMREKYQSSMSLCEQFAELNKEVSEKVQTRETQQETIESELRTVAKIVNPHSGIFKKLSLINDRLSQIDKELS